MNLYDIALNDFMEFIAAIDCYVSVNSSGSEMTPEKLEESDKAIAIIDNLYPILEGHARELWKTYPRVAEQLEFTLACDREYDVTLGMLDKLAQ